MENELTNTVTAVGNYVLTHHYDNVKINLSRAFVL